MTVATAGEDLVLTYANQALKTQVEKLLLSHQINKPGAQLKSEYLVFFDYSS